MKLVIGFIVVLCGMLSSCSREPEPINYGKDNCEHCKMTIMDNKFGTEMVSEKGKIFKFDAIECMVAFINEKPEKDTSKTLLLVTNIANPGEFTDARKAYFLKDRVFHSPMGANLAAFSVKQLAENNRRSADAEIFTWAELLKASAK